MMNNQLEIKDGWVDFQFKRKGIIYETSVSIEALKEYGFAVIYIAIKGYENNKLYHEYYTKKAIL